MTSCYFEDDVILVNAVTKHIRLSGSRLRNGLSADSVTVRGDMHLSDGFVGNVQLHRGSIDGSLRCENGTFENLDGVAIAADSITVTEHVILGGRCQSISETTLSTEYFSADGEVRLLNAKVGGNLICVSAVLESSTGIALAADGIDIDGNVNLGRNIGDRSGARPMGGPFRVIGDVRFPGARIGSYMSCQNATIKGEVSVPGARIGQDLGCQNVIIENSDGRAFRANAVIVQGHLLLRNLSVQGETLLLGAEIGGDLLCSKVAFTNPAGKAFSADRINVNGSVFLTPGFHADGEVRFLGARIKGNLEFDNGRLESRSGPAFFADGVNVTQSVFLRNGFNAKGTVRLVGAKISGDLDCQLGRFEAAQESMAPSALIAFDLTNAHVERTLWWRDLEILGRVRLAHATVGALSDDMASWPGHGSLDLFGFKYDEFAFAAPTNGAVRKEWLSRQMPFRPQPYEQAISVLRRMGHESDARVIGIAKRIALRQSGSLSRTSRVWSCILEVTVSYGYEPWRALVALLVFWVFGMAIFDLGYSFGLISPADLGVISNSQVLQADNNRLPLEYPRFTASAYSLDVFLPIVDLHQESHWLPNMRSGWGWALWVYMWLHIIAGWFLTTILVATLSGLIKKD